MYQFKKVWWKKTLPSINQRPERPKIKCFHQRFFSSMKLKIGEQQRKWSKIIPNFQPGNFAPNQHLLFAPKNTIFYLRRCNHQRHAHHPIKRRQKYSPIRRLHRRDIMIFLGLKIWYFLFPAELKNGNRN